MHLTSERHRKPPGSQPGGFCFETGGIIALIFFRGAVMMVEEGGPRNPLSRGAPDTLSKQIQN